MDENQTAKPSSRVWGYRHLKTWWEGLSVRVRRSIKVVLIVLILFFSFFDLSKELSPECHDENYGGKPWRVCITYTKGSESRDVLYYFHGYLESEKGWTRGVGLHNRKEIRSIWQKEKTEPPTVLTFSLGRGFFVTPEELPVKRDRNITTRQFVDVILPYMEKKYLPGFQGRRWLMGMSMGGFNALQLYLHHPQLWDRAVLLNPLMPICRPFAPFFSRLGCTFKTFPNLILSTMGSFTLIREHFGTEEEWDAVDPVKHAAGLVTPAHPPLMIQIGTRDDFGFYPGNRELSRQLRERKIHFDYVENSNFFHDKIDAKSVVAFLRRK